MILNETLSQPLVFLIVLLIGFGSGLIYDLRSYIIFLCAKNKVLTIILDIISTLLVFAVFFYCNLKFNYGQFRFFVILSFFIGFLTERFSLGFCIAKIFSWCYNKFKESVASIYGRFKKKESSTKN